MRDKLTKTLAYMALFKAIWHQNADNEFMKILFRTRNHRLTRRLIYNSAQDELFGPPYTYAETTQLYRPSIDFI